MNNSFLSEQELSTMGFKSIGKNILISRYARFYGTNNIEIGNFVRIDDFCILSGKIKLGSYIHISAFSALFGSHEIEMEDYTGLSPRCTILSASDDFSGNYFIGPMIEKHLTNITGKKVLIQKYSQLGCNCVVFPGITIKEGVAVGAMSLVLDDLDPWKIYKGIPAVFHKTRSRNLLNMNLNEL